MPATASFDYSDKGRRVRLVSHDDPWTDLEPGDEGTVTARNNYDLGDGPRSTLFVDWDNGSRLGLVEGADRWEWL